MVFVNSTFFDLAMNCQSDLINNISCFFFQCEMKKNMANLASDDDEIMVVKEIIDHIEFGDVVCKTDKTQFHV